MPRASQLNPYIEELQQQALEINRELHAFCNDYLVKLAYVDMQPLNSDDYYEGKKDRKPFRPKETPLKRIEKEEGVSLWLKLKAAFTEDAKKELADKKEKAKTTYAEVQKYEAERNRRLAEDYYAKQKENHEYYDKLKLRAKNNYQEPTIEYFADVLLWDKYQVDGGVDYPIECSIDNYDQETHYLSISYRVPNPEEVAGVKEFKVDKKAAEIIPVPLSKKASADRNRQVMRSLLLRAVALVYLSDTYKNIKNLRIVGYLSYYDEYLRQNERRDVVKLIVSRADFGSIQRMNLDITSIDELFERLAAKKRYETLSSLYKKGLYETGSIYE